MPTADLGDIALNYSEHGEGSPVMGVMGFSLDKRFWGPQIPAVTKTHRFVLFDNRGVGLSTGGSPASIDQMADDTFRLMDHLEIETAVLFGMSMGGTIAQRLVLDHPDRVEALILAVTWARPTEFQVRQHDVTRRLLDIGGEQLLLPASLLRLFTPRFFEIGRDAVDRLMEAAVQPGRDSMTSVEVLKAQLDAMDKHDVLADLGTVTCPTLVISATMDQMAPAFAGEEIAAAIPGAEMVMLDSSHGAALEHMDAFNEPVEAFLARLPSARSQAS